jgi:hypothetical protein
VARGEVLVHLLDGFGAREGTVLFDHLDVSTRAWERAARLCGLRGLFVQTFLACLHRQMASRTE